MNHALQCRNLYSGQVTRFAKHRLFHQGIARTNRDAVPARNTGRLIDGDIVIPNHPRPLTLPVNGQHFAHLQILAGLDATSAKNALVGVVTVERIAVILLVRFWLKRIFLMRHFHGHGSIVDCAVAVVVVTYRAVEFVVVQNAVHRFFTGKSGCDVLRLNLHPC